MRYGLSAMLLLAISASSIRAAGPLLREIKPWTIATKSWGSDAVVVGTVTFIERELIEAKRHPNATETMAHLIAVVKVDSVIKGWKTTTHVRVGFVEIEPSNEHGFNLDDGNMCRILNLLEHETYLLFLNKHPDFAFYTFDFVRAAPLPVPGPARYCPDVVAAEIAVGEQAALFDVMRALREGDSIDLENPLDSKPSMADATLTTEAQRLTALRSGKIDLNPADFDSAFDDNDEISIPLFSAQSGLTLLREKWLGSPETGETYPRRAEKVAFRSAKSSWARPRGAERECWRQPLFAERKATFSARLGFRNRRWGGVRRIRKSAFRDVSLLSTPSICSKLSTTTPNGVPLMRALFLASLLILVPSVALAKRAASRTPVQSAVVVSVILLGNVTEIDKDPVEAESGPGTKDKVPYMMATVKVTEALRGLKTETHVKVGFMPSGRSPLNLVEKQDYLLFLTKHHSGNFYTMNFMNPPLAITKDTTSNVDEVKAIGKILADPAKALKAEKVEDKALAAAALILHYRSPPEGGAEPTLEAVPLAESQAILKAIDAHDWTATPTVGGFDVIRAFYQLAIGADAGWKQPEPKPGDDATAVLHKAYTDWLAGPGAKFQIQKYVAKKK